MLVLLNFREPQYPEKLGIIGMENVIIMVDSGPIYYFFIAAKGKS
jgi:hypothetical protein